MMAAISSQPPDNSSSASFNTSTVQGIPEGIPRRRSDTSSITSSSTSPVPIPPGHYILPIHGNCPRCHHYHKAASINVRMSADANRASYVCCEKCNEKWFAFGAGNSTRISLLSTQTAEPETVECERDFRYALIEMVRSVTSVASASALASVPEQPSRVPSLHRSLHQGVKDNEEGIQRGPQEMNFATQSTPELGIPGSSLEAVPTEKRTRDLHRLQHLDKSRSLFEQIRSRIKKRFLLLKTSRLRTLLPSRQGARPTTKALGKLPIGEAEVQDAVTTDAISNAEAEHMAHRRAPSSIPATGVGRRKSSSMAKMSTHWGDIDLAHIKRMPREDRVAWFRKQYVQLKAQHAVEYWCKSKSTTTSAPGTEDFRSRSPPPPPSSHSSAPQPSRRYSEDLRLIGSHLQGFSPGELFHAAQSIHAGTSTRFSQAGTAVNSDSITATSGIPHLDFDPNQQGQHLRTPRPPSLSSGPSRLHPPMAWHDNHGRLSVDSLTVNGLGRGQLDRHSMGSIPSLSLTGETAPSPGPPPTNSYTTGDHTSEQSQDVRST